MSLVRAVVIVAVGTGLWGCKDAPRRAEPRPAAAAPAAETASARPPKAASRPSAAWQVPSAAPPDSGASEPSRWVVDELGDCGPAGAAVATPRGVAFVTKSDDVVLAPLGALPRSKSKAGKCAVAPVSTEASELTAFARSPAAVGDAVYWISNGHLARRSVAANGKVGKLEVLATDARDGAHVSTAPPPGGDSKLPAVVAYIARPITPGGALRARIWMEGAGAQDLTVEGAAANTVALATTATGYVALSLEGRSGMSPVHARTVEYAAGNRRLELGEDVVVWLAGPSHPLTQLAAVSHGKVLWGLVAVERDITRFGLAQVAVGPAPRMNSPVTWHDYPNGIDPAPIAASEVCGEPVVLFARPADRAPSSPQELHLAALSSKGLGPSTVVARAKAFSTVSLAPLEGGALVAYVADWRTWTRTVRCR